MIKKRNGSILDSKKGFMQGIVFVVIGLTLFAIISLIGYNTFTELNDDIQASDMNGEGKNVVGNLHNRYPSTVDGAFLTIFALLWIVAMVAGWQADSNPLFLVVIIIVMIILLVGAGFMSNVWEDFITDDNFSTFEDTFPSINFILSNFLLVGAIVSSSVIGIMFMKSRV